MDTTVQNTTDDPFAYLDRNRFTSEKFKIEIRGLPKFYGLNEFKKLLNQKLKLNSCKIKPPKKRSEWLYACFRSEEDRRNAIERLSGYVWKNKKLTAHAASAVPDPLIQKRNDSGSKDTKREQFAKNLSSDELLKCSTVPLWNVSYEDQLALKMKNIKTILEELSRELIRNNKPCKAVDFLGEQCRIRDGIVCELSNIRHVPLDEIQDGYRNKCEFSIGMNEESGMKTVGFRFGAYVDGSTNIGPVKDLPHVPKRMEQVVDVFQNFIRQSELSAYNPENHTGFWKQLTVRLGMNTNELMVIVGGNAESIVAEQFRQIKKDIVDFFEQGDGKCCSVASLYLQNTSLKSRNDGKSLELLSGSSTITEQLCGLKFSISPFSFFQTHTAAAEILFNSVAELMPPSKNVTTLDICCGTGTIGLCMSKNCDQVLGIESEPAAIENAKINCTQNGIENCTFYQGRAEEILPSVIYKAKHDDIVAVVDPPRAGLHKKAIIQLRRTSNIKKLIYLSCNPKAALQNFIDFGRRPSKTLLGSQFFPVRAIPVDNFPHTNHCELILYFERYDNELIEAQKKESKVNKTMDVSAEENEVISETPDSSTMEICKENKN